MAHSTPLKNWTQLLFALAFMYGRLIIAYHISISKLALDNTSLSFDAACDLHSAPGWGSISRTTIPLQAEPGWLYPSKENIEAEYNHGIMECNRHLNKIKNSLKSSFTSKAYNKGIGKECRGPPLLYTLTGALVWPFGPHKECPTYSKCWFGMLICGGPEQEEKAGLLRDMTIKKIEQQIQYYRSTSHQGARLTNVLNFTRLPPFQMSIRALYIHARLLGAEIVTPDQRFIQLQGGEEVLIGQYHTTVADQIANLELRHMYFYPGILFNWTAEEKETWDLNMGPTIFLGGSEDRSLPETSNYCCECDKKSFVVTSPLSVAVPDGGARCPSGFNNSLPICPSQSSSYAGRWIQTNSPYLRSRAGTSCYKNSKTGGAGRVFRIPPPPKRKSPKSRALRQIRGDGGEVRSLKVSYSGDPWFDASGDPCMTNSVGNTWGWSTPMVEDGNQNHWFFSPYQCKYHFYERDDIHKCLKDKHIKHIQFQGDSMSRDLFEMVAGYIGVPPRDTEYLKKTLNRGNKNDSKHSFIDFQAEEVIVSEAYYWDFKDLLSMLKDETGSGQPDVVITNYALAHASKITANVETFIANATQYWSTNRKSPKIKIFQNMRELHGWKNVNFNAEQFLHSGEQIWAAHKTMGFLLIDEFLVTKGRMDNNNPNSDGFHFKGTQKQMEAVMLINMLCNDWLLNSTDNS